MAMWMYFLCLFFLFFFVVPVSSVLWSVGDRDILDLGLWCVLDIGVLVCFFMFDAGEDFPNCDNIRLSEVIGLSKSFEYDEEVCC